MKKIALTLAFILGTSALASFACSCTGDSSPCQCGPNCKCQKSDK